MKRSYKFCLPLLLVVFVFGTIFWSWWTIFSGAAYPAPKSLETVIDEINAEIYDSGLCAKAEIYTSRNGALRIQVFTDDVPMNDAPFNYVVDTISSSGYGHIPIERKKIAVLIDRKTLADSLNDALSGEENIIHAGLFELIENSEAEVFEGDNPPITTSYIHNVTADELRPYLPDVTDEVTVHTSEYDGVISVDYQSEAVGNERFWRFQHTKVNVLKDRLVSKEMIIGRCVFAYEGETDSLTAKQYWYDTGDENAFTDKEWSRIVQCLNEDDAYEKIAKIPNVRLDYFPDGTPWVTSLAEND